MNEIGGYFGLELPRNYSDNNDCFKFNTARNAFKSFLSVLVDGSDIRRKIFLPVFNCPDVYDAIRCGFEDLEIVHYNINENFEPILDDSFDSSVDILYTVNYFSITAKIAERVNLGDVVDNAQAFFRAPRPGVHTLYSARKFVGVADGAYLYTDFPVVVPEPSAVKGAHYLLRRIDEGAEAGYADFIEAEKKLSEAPVEGISNLSEKILSSIDMERIRQIRLENFQYIHSKFGNLNQLTKYINNALNEPDFVPLSYPLLIDKGIEVREMLIKHKVFVPMYWRGVLNSQDANKFERHLAQNTVHLPIDQRYTRYDMDQVVKILETKALF